MTHDDRRSWRSTASAALIFASVLAAGCSAAATGESRSPATRPPTSPSPAQAASVRARPFGVRCLPSQLRLADGPRASEKTEQHTLYLQLRNVSAAGCDLRGYPGIALADGKGEVLPFTYRRHGDQMLTGKPPVLVPISPGGAAYSGINMNTCAGRPIDLARRLRLTVPGADRALRLKVARYPGFDYCGPRSSLVDIAPFEPALPDVFPQP